MIKSTNSYYLSIGQPMILRICCMILFISSLLFSNFLQAQSDAWSDTRIDNLLSNRSATAVELPIQYRTLSLNQPIVQNILWQAPFLGNISGTPVTIDIPTPDGGFEAFQMVEEQIFSEELASQYGETIKAFSGYRIDDPSVSVRVTLSPIGFYAVVFDPENMYMVEPISGILSLNYMSYYKKDNPHSPIACGVDNMLAESEDWNNDPILPSTASVPTALRQFRLVYVGTGEFGVQFGVVPPGSGGTPTIANVQASIATSVNIANGVYKRDVGVTFVNNTPNSLVFLNPATDPYDPTMDIAMLNINQVQVDNAVGDANYDIGHVVAFGNFGGVAAPATCVTGQKAMGYSSSNSSLTQLTIDYFCHESGHQLGANHTYSASMPNCNTGQAGNRYEPGEGTSILAYSLVCQSLDNIQNGSDPFFSCPSINEMHAFIAATATCHTNPTTGPNPEDPTMTCCATLTIPQNTPFVLVGAATDATDQATIISDWEQFDSAPQPGTNGPPDCTSTTDPMFRFVPATSGGTTRIFPSTAPQGNNAPTSGTMNGVWERLPCVARTMNFRLVGRDNNANFGRTAKCATVVTVNNDAAFAVTAPNGGETFMSSTTVTWSGAIAATCATVDIYLSTDGGMTYPTALATNVANNGSASVTFPTGMSTTARIIVQCHTADGNFLSSCTFFDASDNNFTYNTMTTACTITATATATDETCPGASDGTITIAAMAMGCTGTLEYSLDGGPFQASNLFSNVAVGAHTIVVRCSTDVNCTATATATVNAGTDTAPPVITCPANVTINCTASTAPANTGMATATDNCGTPTVTSADVSAAGACPQEMTITRTWTATDAAGNSSTCAQTITVDDSTPPVAPANPAPLTIQCLGDLPSSAPLTAMDDCGGTITAMSVDVFAPGSCSSRWTVTRTWTFNDGCGNVSTTTQTINVVDNAPAISITAPPNQTVNCSYNVFPNPGAAIVTTPCGSSVTVTTSTAVNGPPNCPGTTYNITYTAIDDCGRSASATQIFTIQNEPPVFVCPSDICIIDCPQDNDAIQHQFDDYADLATVYTSCSGSITVTNNFNPNGFINQNCNVDPINGVENVIRYQTVTFTATDQCNRTSTCTALVVITDHTPPVISGTTFDAIRYNNALAQSEYNTWIQQNLANLSATDECNGPTGNGTWAWSPASPNTTMSGPFAVTQVTFTASDGCGNTSIALAKFRLKEEPTANVSGTVYNEENEEVEHVEVSLNDLGMGQMDTYMTGTDGQYIFPEVGVSGNYEVVPYRNDDPLNGVNTLDLIYIGMHILGMDELDSPYQLIAADVNNNGAITAADMVEIRKLILHIITEFSNNDSWRFVDEDYVFPNPSNPFASTFPEVYNINGITLNQIANFIAMKIGDVDGSAAPNELTDGDTRNVEGELTFQVDDLKFETGKIYTVDFKANNFTKVLGYQFSLNFDATNLEFVDVTAGDLHGISADNFGYQLLDRGVLTSSWNNREGVSISDESVLFSLSFKANTTAKLSQLISISSQYTKAEAYNSAVELLDIGLDFKFDDGSVVTNPFALYQNRPNPFANNTVIGFNLPEATKATLTLYDVTGKVIRQYAGDFVKGYNEVSVSQSDLGVTGLMYYRLETETHSATQRMIIITD